MRGNLATIDLPEGYRYLQQTDAKYVVEQLWGNPPSSDTCGFVVPADADLLADESWAMIVSYDDADGHVKDDDARAINYSELLKGMQEGATAANEQRKTQGYPTVQLVGWAEQPSYDASDHKLYWAKNLRFGDTKENTLNYCVRILGRAGVLEMNAVGNLKQLPQVAPAAKAVLAKAAYTQGNRYEDYKEGVDKTAAYGIGGLIAGGILLKTGLLAKLLPLLKFLLIPIFFVGAWVWKLITGRQGEVPTRRRDTPKPAAPVPPGPGNGSPSA